MKKLQSTTKDLGYLAYRWLNPLCDPLQLLRAFPGYLGFFRDWFRYVRMEGAEPLSVIDSYPRIHEKTATTGVDPHYFYQGIWAFQKIVDSRVVEHVDVGSQIDLVGFLTAVCRVTFFDIRPLEAEVENLSARRGTILALPLPDNSVPSLSCLHVAEHVGLGRYGDPLDPLGTKKACRELSRVLAVGGSLYFSTPVGRPRVCFNAHRIHSPQQILGYFHDLNLKELSCVDDHGRFRKHVEQTMLEQSDHACGLFHFTKT
ncbi:MAG: DUF268 domain-containing protein [bacterium]|nr:DUF268 domain-containing protein [bacterium]